MMTLTDYLHQHTTSSLASLIDTIAATCVDIASLLQQGALADIQGNAGQANVQGEQQKKLDVISDDMLTNALKQLAQCAGIASEEKDTILANQATGEYLVLYDPLDGSSNIDINMAVGTIFSILPHPNVDTLPTEADFLQSGEHQLAAGYVLYGTSTVMALSVNQGTVMFSFDPHSQQFVLVEAEVTIPADTQEYAINGSNYRHWLPPMQTYIDGCLQGSAGSRDKNFNTRWVAAMVADVHRILCRGGIFLYPFDSKDPNKAGKLRLMYEANPMSLLVTQANGLATDATTAILTIEPQNIHQRVPVVLGSRNEVTYVKTLHLDHSTTDAQ